MQLVEFGEVVEQMGGKRPVQNEKGGKVVSR